MSAAALIAKLQALVRYEMVSRWHDYLEFQGRNVYRIAAESAVDGEWVKWAEVEATFTNEVDVVVRVATDMEQRDAILKWAQEAHRTGSGHDCGEWMAGHRCTVCGSWVDEES